MACPPEFPATRGGGPLENEPLALIKEEAAEYLARG
jgi:hypothetical protein